jgi:DNA-binding MarR family transcriptional regulator
VSNITDTFRKNYGQLTDEQKKQGEDVKIKAEELLALFNAAIPPEERSEKSRCMAVARTNLEQAIMWACKGIYTTPEQL